MKKRSNKKRTHAGEDIRIKIVAATIAAARYINDPRFWRTERGFHGAFYYELWGVLLSLEVLCGARILEMEYQKSHRHDMSQRPDIILHIPAEFHNLGVRRGNFAVWALKRRASAQSAAADFENLDEMFAKLDYPLGFFLNIDSDVTYFNTYRGAI